MKKIAILIFCIAAVVVGYNFSTTHDSSPKNGNGEVAQKETIPQNRVSPRLSARKVEQADSTSAIHWLLEGLWAASQKNDQAQIQEALKSLTDYLAAHPEAMSSVLDVFKSEIDETKIS